MEPNNFEKTVQHKMDELKIPPSDLVWTNIEKTIRKREKGKRGIIIFFFSFLLLLSGGYWLMNGGKKASKSNQSLENVVKKDSKTTNANDSSSHQFVAGNTKKTSRLNEPATVNTSHASGKTPAKKKKAYSKATNNNDFYSHPSRIKPGKKSTPNITIVKAEINKPQDQLVSGGQPTTTKATQDSSAKLSSNQFSNSEHNKNDIVENSKEIAPASKNISAGDTTKGEKKKDRTSAAIKKASSLKKSATSNRKYPWTPGITLSGGTSWISNGSFEENYAYLSAPGSYYNGGSPGGYAYYPPSAFKASIAFMAGFFVEKNISPKTKISYGLTYKYFSVANKVGSRIDSFNSTQNLSSNFYSAGNNIHSFRNNFHFLDIPVSIKISIK